MGARHRPRTAEGCAMVVRVLVEVGGSLGGRAAGPHPTIQLIRIVKCLATLPSRAVGLEEGRSLAFGGEVCESIWRKTEASSRLRSRQISFVIHRDASVIAVLFPSDNHIVSRLLILATRMARLSCLAGFNHTVVRRTTATKRIEAAGRTDPIPLPTWTREAAQARAEEPRSHGQSASSAQRFGCATASSIRVGVAGMGRPETSFSSPCRRWKPKHRPRNPECEHQPTFPHEGLEEFDQGVGGWPPVRAETEIVLGAAEPCAAEVPL